MSISTSDSVPRRAFTGTAIGATLLLLALAAGAFARFSGINHPYLAIDEYYTVRSIEFILEHGVPAFPSGGYYARGLLYQYLAAASVALTGEGGIGYRLPGVLFSLLGVPLAYLYARRFVGPAVALAVAVALLVSSWQIEFARLVRMYPLFQCATLLFLLALDEAYFRGRWPRRYLPHAAAVLATLAHELGVFFAPLLFLPLLPGATALRLPGWAARLRFAAVSAATLVLCLVAAQVVLDLRNLGVADALPADYTLGEGGLAALLFTPAFPFWRLHAAAVVNLGAAVALAAAAAGAVLLLRRRWPALRATDAWLAALVVLAAAHQLAAAAAVLLVLVLRHRLDRVGDHPRRTYAGVGLALVIGAGWLVWGLAAPVERLLVPEVVNRWDIAGPELTIRLKALWTTFFGWPEIYNGFLRPFALELPLIGLLLLAALIYSVAATWDGTWCSRFRHPAFIIVYTLALFTVLHSNSTTRYWFHLYPVILCLFGLVLSDLARRVRAAWPAGAAVPAETGAAAALLAVFALSSDFNPNHLAHAGDPRVTLRTGEFRPYAGVWYPRSDHASPARYVDAHAAPGAATRVIVDDQPPASYYLAHDHAIYHPRGDRRFRFPRVSRAGGTVELWSDRRLLSTADEVAAYTEGATEVWIVRSADPRHAYLDVEAAWGLRLRDQARVFAGVDGAIEVLRVTLADERE